MRRPSYRAAILWMADNDDTTWIEEDGEGVSVTAALVADMFGVPDTRVRNDLTRLMDKRAVIRAHEFEAMMAAERAERSAS